MRIAIDATSLLLRSAGIKNYTWHWLRHLRALAGKDTIRAFPFLGEIGELDHEHSVLSRARTLPRLALLYAANVRGLGVIDWYCSGMDVFHASNQVRVAPRRTKVTATVHDLTCWLMPELHTDANVRADKEFADRVLKRSAGLIAVSENTRQDAIRQLGMDPSRIETIYSGVDERFFTAAPRPSAKPYVLYVGTIEPRKNVDTLLDAWAALKPSIRREFDLWIAGATGWNSAAVERRLSAPPNGVKYLAYVPEDDLPGLTAGAAAFAYVSLYEGFGFPVAQAMAAGVPVITSNTSCLPEVAGEGGVFVDPRSPSEIAAAIERLLEDPGLRKGHGDAGRARAQSEFRWDACARKSLAFFERVAGGL